MNNLIVSIADVAPEGTDRDGFPDEFGPAVRPNALLNSQLYAVPFQNSTLIILYNKEHFAEAPVIWADWIEAAKTLSKPEEDRWCMMMPSNYDHNGWLEQPLSMVSAGSFYNTAYPGEIFYDHASTKAALKFWRDMAPAHKAMPTGVNNSKAVSTAFFAGKSSMIVLSTRALSFARDNAEFDYDIAFMPSNVHTSVPIGGASLVSFRAPRPSRRPLPGTSSRG